MRNGLRAFLVSIRLFAIALVLSLLGCRTEFSDFDSAKYNDRFQAADVAPVIRQALSN